jgi:hypothetical protein
MVMPIVGRIIMVWIVPRVVAIIPASVGMMPAPSVMESVVIPSIIIIIRTIVVAWPPPVVTHVNT